MTAEELKGTRRHVLAGAGLAGVAGVLSACSSGSSSPGASSPGASGSGASGSGASGSGGTQLGAVSEIPEGGGKIYTAAKVVVTQPASGEYKAFSAVCTHMGCIVDNVANGTIDCPCHGSRYSISDGHVVSGPAPSPLPTENIKISGGEITLS